MPPTSHETIHQARALLLEGRITADTYSQMVTRIRAQSDDGRSRKSKSDDRSRAAQ